MLPVKSSLLPTVTRFFDDDWTSLFNWKNHRDFLHSESLPSVNIKESKEDFMIEMAAPGMAKDDFSIEVKNNVLSIRGESKTETSNEEKSAENYTRKEFSYRSFQRSFTLNNDVMDDANIKANYENGILSLCIPKKEEAKEKAARLIEIS